MPHNVFTKTLHDLRGQILGWGIALTFPITAMVLFFPSIQGVPEFKDLLGVLPEPIRMLIGDPSILNSVEGFLRFKLFEGPLPLLFGVLALMQGATMIAGEQEHGTLDLLLAQPVKRWQVMLQKFAAMGVSLFVLCTWINIVLLLSTNASGARTRGPWLVLATYNVIPLALVFGAIGMLGSSLFHRTRHAAMLAGFVLLWSFFLDMLMPLLPSLHSWRWLSLFSYYSQSLSLSGAIHWGSVATLLGVLMLLVMASLLGFERKDLTL